MPTAIITGASRGLGYALAEQLVAAGWHLIIDARGSDAIHDAATSLRGSVGLPGATGAGGGSVDAIPGDITSAAHRADLIGAALDRGGLDLLINNAGILGPSPLPSTADLSADALREIIEVNVIAPLALTQAALPLLRAARGIVLDVTSDAAVEGYPGWGGYGAAKAATEQLRNVLAAEEAEIAETAGSGGVTVWRVDPGDLRTEMHQLAFPGEDISDRPLPTEVAPGLLGLLAARPGSGRYRLASFAKARQTADRQGVDPGRAADLAALGSEPVALWLTIKVDDFEPAIAFYRDTLRLPVIDRWSADDGAGAVFAVGPASRIEVERSGRPTAGALAAVEYPGLDVLIAIHAHVTGIAGASPTPVIEHRRGHSGFSIRDPRGTEIYLWSEE